MQKYAMCLNVVLMIFWNFQKNEEDISVAAKAKIKEVSMEEALWKFADNIAFLSKVVIYYNFSEMAFIKDKIILHI